MSFLFILLGSRDWHLSSIGDHSSSSHGYGGGWRLPDKLRIVKPLEGSLTLHHWQRLAKPHLGNILEERSGVATKGNVRRHKLEEVESDLGLSDFEEDCGDESLEPVRSWIKPDATRTNMTFTDCTVMHPDDLNLAQTKLTSSYEGLQLSSGFYDDMSRSVSRMSSRCTSQMSSRRGSVSESGYCRRPGALTFSSNIGLARVLNERHIGGHMTGSTTSLNTTVNSLTPSIISTPTGVRSFTPTGTPLNSPMHTPPGTPPEMINDQNAGAGLVQSFFSSVKAALYGEQQKEAKTQRIKRKKSMRKTKTFGILQKVEEVGVENLIGASPVPSSSSRESSVSRTSSSDDSSPAPDSKYRMPHTLSDFDLRFMHNAYGSTAHGLDQSVDELEDISPGSLTMPSLKEYSQQDPTVGQLSAPTFSMYGRPSLSPGDFGRVPSPGFDSLEPTGGAVSGRYLGASAVVGGRGPGRVISSPGEKRPAQLLGAMGVPGQPGTGALMTRPDLGSVPVTSGAGGFGPRSPMDEQQQAGFIGNIASMFFGRKGGLL